MSFLTIYQDNYTDSTVISNRFIDEYMQAANDAQLKIYLYLIRMMSARLDTSIGDIADKFNYTEKDVMRALKYWEKNRLLTLDYDERKNIVGIHLLDSVTTCPSVSVHGPVPAVAEIATAPSYALETPAPTAHSTYETPEKPNYTADQLRAFKADEDSARLLFVAEQYLKRPLSRNDICTIYFIIDKLSFSEDLTDYLLQYCVDRGKRDMRYIEKVALSWAEQGITTPKQAAALAGKYDKTVYEVMRALGKNSIPTEIEVAYIDRWRKFFGFDADVVFDACERTVLATDNHRFEYANRILESWHKAGVHHKDDIKTLDDSHHRTKSSRPVSTNKFNQFKQNNYDFDALEKEILSN